METQVLPGQVVQVVADQRAVCTALPAGRRGQHLPRSALALNMQLADVAGLAVAALARLLVQGKICGFLLALLPVPVTARAVQVARASLVLPAMVARRLLLVRLQLLDSVVAAAAAERTQVVARALMASFRSMASGNEVFGMCLCNLFAQHACVC